MTYFALYTSRKGLTIDSIRVINHFPMMLILSIPIGLILSVLINYFADVLPNSRTFSRPVCPGCQSPYQLRDYLFSLQCSQCAEKRSLSGLYVTLITVLCSVLLAIYPLDGLGYWATLPILMFLGVIIKIDIEHHVVLKETSFIGLIQFFIYGMWINGIPVTLLGGLAGFLLLLTIYSLGSLLAKSIRKNSEDTQNQEVMFGFGDVLVGTFLGFFVGWPIVLRTLLIALCVAGLYSLVYIIVMIIKRRYRKYSSIPLTPFLIIATIISLYIP